MKYCIVLIGFLFITACDSKAPSSPDSKSSPAASAVAYNDLNVDDAMTLPDAIYLDVRTQEEVDEGKIPNSVHIDFRKENFAAEIAKLDKSKEYVVYCRSGGRSSKASQMMIDLGFKKVSNMAGGYNEYKVVME